MHTSVLLHEAVNNLNVVSGGHYVDCTFGGGGHSKAIADKGAKVLALDADPDAMERLPEEYKDRVTLVHSNFEHVEDVATKYNYLPVQGVLFDLGLSSFHLADAERGFAFLLDGPLDMRFDNRSHSHTAGQLIDALPEEVLADLFKKYGEEPHAEKIARMIKRYEPWAERTTKDLADLIEEYIPRQGKIHPATRVFQALRMAVNDETGVLERGLNSAIEVLDRNGRMVVISFHSIEDRIVKEMFQEWERQGRGNIVGDVITPSEEEVGQNPRSRSAKMRIFQKN